MPFGVYGSGPQCSCFTIFLEQGLLWYWLGSILGHYHSGTSLSHFCRPWLSGRSVCLSNWKRTGQDCSGMCFFINQHFNGEWNVCVQPHCSSDFFPEVHRTHNNNNLCVHQKKEHRLLLLTDDAYIAPPYPLLSWRCSSSSTQTIVDRQDRTHKYYWCRTPFISSFFKKNVLLL